MNTTRFPRAILALLAIIMLAAACADSDPEPAAQPTVGAAEQVTDVPDALPQDEVAETDTADALGGSVITSIEPLDLVEPTPTPAAAEPELQAGTPDDDSEADPNSTPTPTPLPTPTPAGPQGAPLRVAGVITASIGPVPIFDGACEGARARFERANRDLELVQRIEFVDCLNDNGNGATNTEHLEALTEDGRIFAVVPATSVALLSADLLNERRIPYIGDGNVPAFCGSSSSFGFGTTGALGCPVLSASTTPVVSVPYLKLYSAVSGIGVEDLRVVIVRSDGTLSELVSASIRLEANEVGADVIADLIEVPSPTQGSRESWDPVVDEIVDTDANLVIVDGANTDQLFADLGARFEGAVVGTAYTDPAEIAADEDLAVALEGSFQISQGYDAAFTRGGGHIQMLEDLAAIGIEADILSRNMVGGYAAADLLVTAIADTPSPVTPEALHNTINGDWFYPGIDGLVCPGWWPASHVVGYPCGSVAMVTNGQLESLLPVTSFEVIVGQPGDASIEEDE